MKFGPEKVFSSHVAACDGRPLTVLLVKRAALDNTEHQSSNVPLSMSVVSSKLNRNGKSVAASGPLLTHSGS